MRKKILLFAALAAVLVCLFAISASAAAPIPAKPDLGIDFGTVSTIDGFTPPSQLYVDTEQRVLLTDGNGAYATYPTYYVTKDSTTFDFDFSKLNAAQSVQYDKKSVVLLEIPNGVTTISNSYFAGTGNFPACLSVQAPGTVTSYGASMFNTNTVIRIVEFLDGTEPVTMGDGMFGANWNSGADKIGYVRFPNNLVSIGNNTFGKSKGSSKVIILGANLKTVGTGFFGEGTPNTTDTFLFVSDNFFKDVDLFSNLFGSHAPYHGNQLRITLFYTGSQAQAQSLVDKGLAVQTGYVWSKATLVSASEYDYETHKPKTDVSITIVYDYEKCDAFYGGHAWKGTDEIVLDSYFEEIGIGDTCANCGKSDVKNTLAPIFEWKGYSVSTFGDAYAITQGYVVNKASLELYEQYVGDVEVGFAAAVNLQGEEFILDFDSEGVLSYSFNQIRNDYIEITASGIPEAHRDTLIVFCAYVKNGGSTCYLDNNKTSNAVLGISYNQVLELCEK